MTAKRPPKKRRLKERPLAEFQRTGLVWFINRFLHVFGWAIVMELDGNKPVRMYPARTSFRGFSPETELEGFHKVGTYLAKNAEHLAMEADLDSLLHKRSLPRRDIKLAPAGSKRRGHVGS